MHQFALRRRKGGVSSSSLLFQLSSLADLEGGFEDPRFFFLPGPPVAKSPLRLRGLAGARVGFAGTGCSTWLAPLVLGRACVVIVTGSIGSILSPFLFGVIVQYTGSWVYPFILASSLLVVGSVIWLFIKPEYSVNEELGLN